MGRRASLVASSFAIMFLLLTPNIVFAANPKHILSIAPDFMGGVVTGAGGVFFVDYSNGNIFHWDSSNGQNLIASPYPEGVSDGYNGIAVKSFSGLGLRVAVITDTLDGLYYCNSATFFSCGSESGFIPLIPSVCSSMPAGFCNPTGLAFDKAGNLWYADPSNDMECELDVRTGYTSFVQCNSAPVGATPVGIFIDSSGNHWLADDSCNGDVIENDATLFSIGDSIGSIVISNKNPVPSNHIYVGIEGFCSSLAPGIKDLNDGLYVTKFGSQVNIPGISTGLYFTTNNFLGGDLWKTKDKT